MSVLGISSSPRLDGYSSLFLDPARPLDEARAMGERPFRARVTDYRLETERPSAVWPPGP